MLRPAAQYIRMSTDNQDLSPEIQKGAIEAYATLHGLTVVQTYLDAGKSGLTLHKRPAMKRLLSEVTDERCPYSVVLVYDVSRWGRFQDTDASAYYEYHCRLHGIDVRYVQEPFSGTDSPLAALFKNMKRTMAAEYSRELSAKTSAGQTLAVRKGFHLGTRPCLGTSRIAVSKADGTERALAPTDHKAARTEHMRWVQGPDHEIETVKRIFDLYANTELSVVKVAALLRAENIRTRNGRLISEWMLYSLLRSEAVLGNFVWGRAENKKPRALDDPRVRRDDGFMKPIVSRATFDAVQAKLARRTHAVLTKDTILQQLRSALRLHPEMMRCELKAHGCACRETYKKHFGSLKAAWEAAGATQVHPRAIEYSSSTAATRIASALCQDICTRLNALGVDCTYFGRPARSNQTLLLRGKTILRVQAIWKRPRYDGEQWSIRKVYQRHFDWVLIVRISGDQTPVDAFLVSREQYFALDHWLHDHVFGVWEWHHTGEEISSLFNRLCDTQPVRNGE